MAVYALLQSQFQENSPADSNTGQSRLESLQNTSVPFEEVNKKEEENYLNTVTTIDPDSIAYKLVSIGDRRPKFYINNQQVPQNDLEKYSVLINQMKRQLWKRRENVNVPGN